MKLNFFTFFFINNYFLFNLKKLINIFLINILTTFKFLPQYFHLNELIWQEGLLIDFLQKKITDNWIKKFVIYSSYLFNEKLVFDEIVKAVLNLLIWPLHKLSIFEFDNTSNLLFITIFFFIITFFFLLFFVFLII